MGARIGKIPEYLNHGLVPTPDDASFVFIYKLAGANSCYAKKSDGNYFLIGGSESVTFQDSSTIEFFEPSPGIVSARTVLTNKLSAIKQLTDSAVLYFKKTASIAPANQRYNSPEQARLDSSYIQNFDSVTDSGELAGTFNSATGIWTVPSDGFYNIGYLLGYRMRNADKHVFTSDGVNVAMAGNYWITVPGTKASFGLALMTVSGTQYLYCYSEKILDQNTNNIYLTQSQIVYLTAGQEISTVYINDTDLPGYGCVFSVYQFNAVKVSN